MADFYTEPFEHQRKEYYHSRDKANFALLWEPGTGKSKPILDTTAYLSDKDAVDGSLIIAPNGVHRNWIIDQIPAHCDPAVPLKTFLWDTKKAGNKSFQAEFEEFLKFPQLVVFAINYDAIITARGYAACEKFLKKRVCIMTCDESHRIKSPGKQRTKAATKLGKLAKYRRILTGTPIATSPFDLFSQFGFLDQGILGYKSFFVFKQRFGIFETQFNGPRRYLKLVRHKNMDELKALIEKHSSRVTKDVLTDLPDKLYSKAYYEMSARQAGIYSDLRESYMAELQNGTVLTAPHALVRLLRLQQIVCGYAPSDSHIVAIDDKHNPRIKCLLDTVQDHEDSKILIWARFVEDIRQISEALPPGSFVTYYGASSEEERVAALKAFKEDPSVKYFVSNPAVGGEGLTLTEASVAIFYSNSFKLVERLQAEDRCHRIGQRNKVLYIDIVCPNTVDDRIVSALRDKQNIASVVTGDRFKTWI